MGVVERYKGRITGDRGTDLGVLRGVGTVFISTSATAGPVSITKFAGVDQLTPVALSGGSIYRLPVPYAGITKTIVISTISGSTIVFLTASTDGSVTITGVGSTGSTAVIGGSGGTTLSNTIKATQSVNLTLVGLSSKLWLFDGVIPSSAGVLTFSSST